MKLPTTDGVPIIALLAGFKPAIATVDGHQSITLGQNIRHSGGAIRVNL